MRGEAVPDSPAAEETKRPPTLAEDEAKFVANHFEKKRIKEREKEINAEQAEITERVREAWEEQGKTSSGLTTATLYLKKEGFVKVAREGENATAAEKQRACDALVAADLGEFVERGFNSRSVSTVAREQHWDQELPPELEGALTFDPEWKLAVRKKDSKKAESAETLGS
jgi:uncharacterized protein YxeA